MPLFFGLFLSFLIRISLTTTFETLEELQEELVSCSSKCTKVLIELLQERSSIFGIPYSIEPANPVKTAFLLQQEIANEFYDYVESKAFAEIVLSASQNCFDAFFKNACKDLFFPVQLPKVVAGVAKWMPKAKAHSTEMFFEMASMPIVERYCEFILGNY